MINLVDLINDIGTNGITIDGQFIAFVEPFTYDSTGYDDAASLARLSDMDLEMDLEVETTTIQAIVTDDIKPPREKMN